ncbi:MAG TPA: transposase [Terracidiphilus sp.]|jgi:putative transposase|nr:transposase [Terracidiphilus sp.]
MKGKLIRYQQTGEFHFLTLSCYRRRPYLSAVAAMERFENALERVRLRYLLVVGGYVGMPEHVHMLVNEPQRGLLSRAVQALKLSVSMRAWERPFWQAHSYDFNISAHGKFVEKLRCIHRNPVRRGLVAKPEDWKWSSYRHYQTGMRGVVEIESEWTALQRGWQLPEWMRLRQVDSPSLVPPPRRTRNQGHPQPDRIPLEIEATRRKFSVLLDPGVHCCSIRITANGRL